MKTTILFPAFLVSALVGCAGSDPRGHHPINVGNTSNPTRMVQEGRDTHTYTATQMPMPDTPNGKYEGEMPQTEVQGNYDDIKIDDKIDFTRLSPSSASGVPSTE
ncbi:hypothetical protein SAMN05720766_13015 [Fibrobacter sp. UWH9]|uniref:hypothetical protein n=1 Tax=Fibrobacter sp. UWH9 TaxID=1896213 RepID=UPI00091E768E|nr:hypothetical protein [Fibrobacter sp. UWH9]SHH85725.1 hypothetical protein SAMN05720766_13015 [Fibrobacter sp. UWH9]